MVTAISSATITAKAPWATWLGTVALAMTALAGGVGMVAPVCYLQGRMRVQLVRWQDTPLAWSGRYAPAYGIIFALAVIWSAFWLLHTMRAHQRGLSLAHAVAPMAVFLWSAWQASLYAHSCNIY